MGDTLDNRLTGWPSVIRWWWSDWIEHQEEELFWYQVCLEVECAWQEKEQLCLHFDLTLARVFKNKSCCVRTGNKAILFTTPRGCGTNSVHLPENRSSWLHYYPLCWNHISSHNEGNETYPNASLKALFGYHTEEDTKEHPVTLLSSTTTTPIRCIWLNLTSTSSCG